MSGLIRHAGIHAGGAVIYAGVRRRGATGEEITTLLGEHTPESLRERVPRRRPPARSARRDPRGRRGGPVGQDESMRLVPEMVYRETIAGPWGPTTGSPFGARVCWSVTGATLRGERIDARLAMPGADWIRLGPDGIRRQDQRLTFETVDGAVVMLSYDNALIRETPSFLAALADGGETTVDDQYMRMVAQFDTGDDRYAWLTRSLFIGAGRVAGDHAIEYTIYRLD